MTTPPATYKHVIVIMMENKSWNAVLAGSAPYLKGLAAQCGTDTSWQDAGSAYNSEPNYIALVTGVADSAILNAYKCDCPPSIPRGNYWSGDNLFKQVRAKGGTERSYQENMSSDCQLTDGGRYAVKHNPGAFMGINSGGTYVPDPSCATDNVATVSALLFEPASPFYQDISNGTLPTFSLLTPNLCNDMHDCGVSAGDNYLGKLVPVILDSSVYWAGATALFIIWDEDTPIPNVVVAPSVTPGLRSAVAVSHYSLLRAIEEMLGLPLLGGAQTASELRAVFNV